MAIEAPQVRLKTKMDDLYPWERMEEKEHLSSKDPGDLSTGQLTYLGLSGSNVHFALLVDTVDPERLTSLNAGPYSPLRSTSPATKH